MVSGKIDSKLSLPFGCGQLRYSKPSHHHLPTSMQEYGRISLCMAVSLPPCLPVHNSSRFCMTLCTFDRR